ncbi:hypothetical protein SJ05684_c10370 [Sinorhizobium sojae CCBAU 05684]|uniref:Uncharacterized protein n=1 Tax=Sinorhizobium sojae CCBAU 05684 TaxID=716928 RepID=A0A249P9N9_9HYPH|nr:hypothetical protein SJ05684_c10370 [Sinorhizobium sojae CCBAU 05684]
MTIPHSLRCPDCKRDLTAAEVIERWCEECRKPTKTEDKRRAA